MKILIKLFELVAVDAAVLFVMLCWLLDWGNAAARVGDWLVL